MDNNMYITWASSTLYRVLQFDRDTSECTPWVFDTRAKVRLKKQSSSQAYNLDPLIKVRHIELHSLSLRFQDAVYEPVVNEPEVEVPMLSSKEWQCLYLASKGMTEKEMASTLTRSADTVKFHLRNAAKKLSAKNRTQAVALAMQMGMIKA